MIISKSRDTELQIERIYGVDFDADQHARLLWQTTPVQKDWYVDHATDNGAAALAYWNMTTMGGDWVSVKKVLSPQDYADRFGIAVGKESLNDWTIEEFRLVKAVNSDNIDKDLPPHKLIKRRVFGNDPIIECDSIVILPAAKEVHESGYRLMEIVALEGRGDLAKPICRIVGSDHDAVEFKDGRGKFAAPSPDSNWVHLLIWRHDILATSGLVHSWSSHGKIRIHHASATIEIVHDFHEDEV